MGKMKDIDKKKEADKLPTIFRDKLTDMRYVRISGKKVWLTPDVTKKNLLKYILRYRSLKRRKRKAKKDAKAAKAKKDMGEITSKSFAGDLAAKALVASQSSKKEPDTAKIVRDVLALMPGKEDKLVEIPKEGVLIHGKRWTAKQLEARAIEMEKEAEAKVEEEKERTAKEKKKARAAQERAEEAKEKEKKALDDKSAAQIDASIHKVMLEIPKAQASVVEMTTKTLEARARNADETLGQYLKRKAKQYKITGKTTRPVLLPQVMRQMLDDEKEDEFADVIAAKSRIDQMELEVAKLKKMRDKIRGGPQMSPSPSPPPLELIDGRSVVVLRNQIDRAEEEEAPSTRRHWDRMAKEYARRQRMEEVRRAKAILDAERAAEEESFLESELPSIHEGKVDEEGFYQLEGHPLEKQIREMESKKQKTFSTWQQEANLRRAIREREAADVEELRGMAEEEDREEVGRVMSDLVDEVDLKDAARQAEAISEGRRLLDERMARKMHGLGSTRNRVDSQDGLSTSQIDGLMSPYPDYLGCIGSDQVGTLDIKPKSRLGFVMNLDPSYKKGSHWIAVYVDGRPNGDMSVEYYDPLADPPSRRMISDAKMIAEKLGAGNNLKFKVNKIADQDDDTANCGYFACKFLIDRFRGKSFAEASGFNSRSPTGERNIEAWKRSLGIEPFRYLSFSEDQEGEGFREVVQKGIDFVRKGVQRVKDVFEGVRQNAPPAMRRMMEKYGETQIVQLKVCRKPIFTIIEKLANLLSLGKYEENKAKFSYDRMFHLFMVIKLSSGECFKIEKNHVVEIGKTSWEQEGKGLEEVSGEAGVTLNQMVSGSEKLVGPSKLWVYDARTQNCQFFIQWLLKGCGRWTPELQKFVMQNAAGVLKDLDFLGKAARVVTDVAGVADVAMQGAGANIVKKRHRQRGDGRRRRHRSNRED